MEVSTTFSSIIGGGTMELVAQQDVLAFGDDDDNDFDVEPDDDDWD